MEDSDVSYIVIKRKLNSIEAELVLLFFLKIPNYYL